HGCFCRIPCSLSQLDDTCVTSRTTTNFFGDRSKQLGNGFLVLQITENRPPLVRCVFLCLCDQRLNISSERFCLCERCYDSLMRNQLAGEITEQGTPVSCLSAEVID